MEALLLSALGGLIFGSFITLASWRLPRDEDIYVTSSRCPACGTRLKVRDLFPVLSWLMSRRCRYCSAPVHWRYPVVELLTAALFVLVAARYGISAQTLVLDVLAVMLLIMIVVDFEHYIIPDEVHWVLIPLGITYGYLQGTGWQEMAAGLALGLGLGLALRYGYLYLRKKDALGLGDVKFFAVAGLWLGVETYVPFLFLAGLIGVATGLLWRVLGRGGLFPFGPALAASLFLCVAWPEVPASFWQLQTWLIR